VPPIFPKRLPSPLWHHHRIAISPLQLLCCDHLNLQILDGIHWIEEMPTKEKDHPHKEVLPPVRFGQGLRQTLGI
jgi:hypothetical protein